MKLITLSRIYILLLSLLESFLLGISIFLLMLAIYPMGIHSFKLLSAFLSLIYLGYAFFKYMDDREIAWLYEKKYPSLNEALITYVETRDDRVLAFIPSSLNPLSIYRPKATLILLFLISLIALSVSIHFRKGVYEVILGMKDRVVFVEDGRNFYFEGEEVSLKVINLSPIGESIVLEPKGMIFKLPPSAEQILTLRLERGIYEILHAGRKIHSFEIMERPNVDSFRIDVSIPVMGKRMVFWNRYSLQVFEGSFVEVSTFHDGDSIHVLPSSKMHVVSDTSLKFKLFKRTLSYIHPLKVSISVLENHPPYVEIVYPKEEFISFDGDTLYILGFAEDDVGLVRIELIMDDRKLLSRKPDDALRDTFAFGIFVADRIGSGFSVRVRAYDYQGKYSEDVIYVSVPFASDKLEEAYEDLQEFSTDSLVSRIQALSEDVSRAKANANEGYLKDLERRLRSLAEDVRNIEENLKRLTSKLEMDPELQELVEKLGNILGEIMDEELRKLINEIRSLLESKSASEINRKLTRIKLDLDRMKKALKSFEQTLRRFYQERKLEEIASKLEQLSHLQSQANTPEEQESITRELENLYEQTKELSKELEQPFSDSLANISEDIGRSAELSRELQKLSWTPNRPSACASSSRKLMQLSERVSNLRQQLVQTRKQEIMDKLESIRHQLVFIYQNMDSLELNHQRRLLTSLQSVVSQFEEVMGRNFLIASSIRLHMYSALDMSKEIYYRLLYQDIYRASKFKSIEKKQVLLAIFKLMQSQNMVAQASTSTGYMEYLKQLANALRRQEGMLQNFGNFSGQIPSSYMERIRKEVEHLRKLLEGMRRGLSGRKAETVENMLRKLDELEQAIEKSKDASTLLEKYRRILHELLEGYRGLKEEERRSKRRQAERPKDYQKALPQLSEEYYIRKKLMNIIRKENDPNRLEIYMRMLREF